MSRAGLDGVVDELFARPPVEGVSLALVVQQRGDVIVERYGTQPANDFQPEIEIDARSTLSAPTVDSLVGSWGD